MAAVAMLGLVGSCGGHVAYAGDEDRDVPGATSKGRVWYGGDYGYGEVVEVPIRLNDGRTVTCLTMLSAKGKGIDCDWPGATR